MQIIPNGIGNSKKLPNLFHISVNKWLANSISINKWVYVNSNVLLYFRSITVCKV